MLVFSFCLCINASNLVAKSNRKQVSPIVHSSFSSFFSLRCSVLSLVKWIYSLLNEFSALVMKNIATGTLQQALHSRCALHRMQSQRIKFPSMFCRHFFYFQSFFDNRFIDNSENTHSCRFCILNTLQQYGGSVQQCILRRATLYGGSVQHCILRLYNIVCYPNRRTKTHTNSITHIFFSNT